AVFYTLSLHDALPIWMIRSRFRSERASIWPSRRRSTPRMTRGFVCRGLNRFSYRLAASPSLTPSKDVRNLIASSEVRVSSFAARSEEHTSELQSRGHL